MNGFLDIAAAAQFLCRSPRWVRQHVHEIPHFRVNSQILFRADELLRSMERFRVEPAHIDLRGLLDKVIPTPRRRGSKGRFRDEGGA